MNRPLTTKYRVTGNPERRYGYEEYRADGFRTGWAARLKLSEAIEQANDFINDPKSQVVRVIIFDIYTNEVVSTLGEGSK